MTKLITISMTLVLLTLSATSFAQAKKSSKADVVRPCQVHVLYQGGSPTATTVRVCG